MFNNFYWYWVFFSMSVYSLFFSKKPVQVGVAPKHNPEMDQKKKS